MPATYIGDSGPDGVIIGADATKKVGLYGATPVTQRANSVQATSYLSASSNVTVGANLTAIVMEIANTLIGLGIWKGAA
jgi:hypothetical protein